MDGVHDDSVALTVQCCFCGQGALAAEMVQIVVYWWPDDDAAQALWTHAACLVERLHPDVPVLYDA